MEVAPSFQFTSVCHARLLASHRSYPLVSWLLLIFPPMLLSGEFEGASITKELQNKKSPRPIVYDLFRNSLEALGSKVRVRKFMFVYCTPFYDALLTGAPTSARTYVSRGKTSSTV